MRFRSQTSDLATQADDLLLRETNHRCANDLQLIVSMLALQSGRAADPEVRRALDDAVERVSVLARARSAMHREQQPDLRVALEQACGALRPQAETRSILISLEPSRDAHGLAQRQVTTLALVVNELITNAIKHAFESEGGSIRVTIGRSGERDVSVVVDDDGLPFGEAMTSGQGLGMSLAKRLMASVDGVFIPPSAGSKAFELRVTV